jgi:mannonate dehydratase
MKLSVYVPPRPSQSQLRFVAQLGVRHVYTWVGDDQLDAGSLRALVKSLEPWGLTLYNAGCIRLGKSPAIHLGLEGRDRVIEELSTFIRALAAAGIRVTTFTWEPDQVWSTGSSATRGGAMARAVDAAALRDLPLTRGRRYTESELWDNFSYFMERIIPVAESEGVRLALHPNDPPVDEIAGIPCLIRSAERYRKAYGIAGSKALGMEFCTGCWLEGGPAFGDLLAGIREFGREGRILIVHFRNVSAPLPRFVETFVDDGYMDMAAVMRALEEVDYDGSVILDHSPELVGAEETSGSAGAKGAYPYAATAYAIGYMRALMPRGTSRQSAP